MEWVKKNQVVVTGGVILTLVLFYWFQIRPAQIKKECATVEPPEYPQEWITETEKYLKENCDGGLYEAFESDRADGTYCFKYRTNLVEYRQGPRPANDDEYKQCLRENGL